MPRLHINLFNKKENVQKQPTWPKNTTAQLFLMYSSSKFRDTNTINSVMRNFSLEIFFRDATAHETIAMFLYG